MAQIRTSHAKGEIAPNVAADYEWIRQHENELFEKYGRCCILVYQQQVIGIGQTLAEAETNAEAYLNNYPEDEITPVFEILYNRQADTMLRYLRTTESS